MLVAYIALLIGAEAAAALVSIYASLVIYCGLLLALLAHAVLPSVHRRLRAALASLALVPLLKIAAVSLSQQAVPDRYWEALPATVALIAVVLLRPVIPAGRSATSWPMLSQSDWMTQLAIALVGPLLALLAAATLSAFDRTAGEAGFTTASVRVLAVAALSGFVLEVVFRGVIQPSLVSVLGPIGVVLVVALYGGLFLGSGSLYVFLIGLGTGIVWSISACVTRTFIGVAASHALFSLTWVLLY
jgi:membrane protease YdiL (CAAX protease family)